MSLKRGDTLARQGEPARHFYLVESGFLKLLQLTAEGTELIVRFVSPGEPFGGVVALGDARYPVTAVVAAAIRRPCLDPRGGRRTARRRTRRCASTSCARWRRT